MAFRIAELQLVDVEAIVSICWSMAHGANRFKSNTSRTGTLKLGSCATCSSVCGSVGPHASSLRRDTIFK
jgi:hypothetical protein